MDDWREAVLKGLRDAYMACPDTEGEARRIFDKILDLYGIVKTAQMKQEAQWNR